ncbi:DNA alkylation response protein [Vulcanimicrobium alpinum]|uniref:DNA alkylation response protein n=1 Tax=Vulcanimicrobium alpinum TaxID=3016050 RepID=A0AAN1XZV7_UNVUL|nr:isovaleryl-CoA dehydrogenase [Vulcanimicrobium alpinum]BDE07312.1 DNA alkylation response protein [Vulcanimicrobium alpinum]
MDTIDRPHYLTHEVTNQPPPLAEYNAAASDAALLEGLEREAAGWDGDGLLALGARAGSAEAIGWGFDANRHAPELRTHDRYGHRIDEVAFHPAWHRLMETAVAHGLHGAPWREPRAGAHAARMARFYVWSQVESGHGCPISMTYAAVPVLRRRPDLAALFEPALTSSIYEPHLRPLREKRGALCGMAMTEKQGGSDVRANTTRAEAFDGDTYALTGHKWFCSAPMSDAFLVLAQAAEGLTCFFLPRILPDETRNAFHIQRLKDKLGNRSNASSEIELDAALALRVGDEGRGVATIIEMVTHTRLDCVGGSAALMRQAFVQAAHHARHRRAFGALLADQPLMENVLADLALESEAATTLLMRLAGAVDRSADDPREAAFARIAIALGKYWVCKRAPAHVAEAMECLGGNGYVEESILPRLYREAPVNAIWEGSGNVNALDLLRALAKTPASFDALFAELDAVRGDDARFDAALAETRDGFAGGAAAEPRNARRAVEALALLLQASLLLRYAPPFVAEAFAASRLGNDGGATFGTLPASADVRAIVTRAWPG